MFNFIGGPPRQDQWSGDAGEETFTPILPGTKAGTDEH